MNDAEVRKKILEFLYNNRYKHFESSDLSKKLGVNVEIIDNNLRYLIEKGLINPLKNLSYGFIVISNANGIDYIESFRTVNTDTNSSDIEQKEKEEIKSLINELITETLKTTKDKNKIGVIISKLGKYSRDILSIGSLVVSVKYMLGV